MNHFGGVLNWSHPMQRKTDVGLDFPRPGALCCHLQLSKVDVKHPNSNWGGGKEVLSAHSVQV